MKPVEFPEQNKVFTKPEGMTDECVPLPVFDDGKQLVSLWELSPEEKMKLVFFGKIWLSVYGRSQPPVWMSVEKTVFLDQIDPDPDFLEKYKRRKVEQFLAGFKDIEGEDSLKELLLEFINFQFSAL